MEARNDSESADWRHWFRQHGPKLLLCARQWTRSTADAEDVVQEAFVRYWRHQRGLPGNPLGLLLMSVRRAAIDLARRDDRRNAREKVAEGGLVESDSYFEACGDGDERPVALEAALARLPAEQREVLVIKLWGDLTFEEIGRQLAISPHTAASRYRYALAALRKEMSIADCHG